MHRKHRLHSDLVSSLRVWKPRVHFTSPLPSPTITLKAHANVSLLTKTAAKIISQTCFVSAPLQEKQSETKAIWSLARTWFPAETLSYGGSGLWQHSRRNGGKVFPEFSRIVQHCTAMSGENVV